MTTLTPLLPFLPWPNVLIRNDPVFRALSSGQEFLDEVLRSAIQPRGGRLQLFANIHRHYELSGWIVRDQKWRLEGVEDLLWQLGNRGEVSPLARPLVRNLRAVCVGLGKPSLPDRLRIGGFRSVKNPPPPMDAGPVWEFQYETSGHPLSFGR